MQAPWRAIRRWDCPDYRIERGKGIPKPGNAQRQMVPRESHRQLLTVASLYCLTPSGQLKTGGNRLTNYCLQPPSTPIVVVPMGQNPSKVQNQSATKSASSLKRVSRLFQPGMKRDQHAASDSNRSSPQPSKGEDTATSRPARGEPEAEGRPAGLADDQV